MSYHVLSRDGLLQSVLNPLLNPVSCDSRGTFGTFATGTFNLLLLATSEAWMQKKGYRIHSNDDKFSNPAFFQFLLISENEALMRTKFRHARCKPNCPQIFRAQQHPSEEVLDYT